MGEILGLLPCVSELQKEVGSKGFFHVSHQSLHIELIDLFLAWRMENVERADSPWSEISGRCAPFVASLVLSQLSAFQGSHWCSEDYRLPFFPHHIIDFLIVYQLFYFQDI